MGNLEQLIRRNSLALPLIGVISGILLAKYSGFSVIASILLISFSLFVYYIILRRSRSVVKAYRLRMTHYVWVYLLFVGVGLLVGSLSRPETLDTDRLEKEVWTRGKILDIRASTAGDLATMSVYSVGSGENIHNPSNLKVLLKADHFAADIDDVVLTKAKLNPIEDSPNSFKGGYAGSMANKGILYQGEISELRIEGKEISFSGVAHKIRNQLEIVIEKSGLSKSTENFLITVLLGDRDYLDSQLRRQFADAGVAHVLALSGMHTAIIGGIFLFILFPLNFAGRYKLRLALAAVLLWIYAFISGMSPATVRACIMLTFSAIAILLERKRSPFNALYCAAFVILVCSPSALTDVGFQLSFVCVFSLLAFARPLNFVDHLHHPQAYKVVTMFLATLTATFGSWILTGYYFQSLPLGFLPANLLILPLLPFYMVLSIIHFAVSALGIHIPYLVLCLDGMFDILQRFTGYFSENHTSLGIEVGYESVVLWSLGIILLGIFLNIKREKTFLYPAIMAMILSIVFIPLIKAEIPDGSFILRNDYRDIKITTKTGVEETVVTLDRYINSVVKIGDKKVLAIDAPVEDIKMLPQCDFLFIAGGYKGNMEDLLINCRPGVVVIHTSVRRKREEEYQQVCRTLDIPSHSIRNDLPYRYINR